jgi:hypothetical protein
MNTDPQTCLAAQRADGLPSQLVDRQLMFTDGRIARECFRAEETPAQQKAALKRQISDECCRSKTFLCGSGQASYGPQWNRQISTCLRDTPQFTAIEHKNVKVIDKFRSSLSLQFNFFPKKDTSISSIGTQYNFNQIYSKIAKFAQDVEPLSTVSIPVFTYCFQVFLPVYSLYRYRKLSTNRRTHQQLLGILSCPETDSVS